MAIRFDAAEALQNRPNGGHARFQFAPFCLVIDLEVPFDGGQQPAQLFLAHFHASAYAAERRHRWQGSLDQILASQQQAGRLRAAQGFSSGESLIADSSSCRVSTVTILAPQSSI